MKGKGAAASKSNKLPLASGLRPAFKTLAHSKSAPALSLNEVGGLNDDDIADGPPLPTSTGLATASRPTAGRNTNRRNALVTAIAEASPAPGSIPRPRQNTKLPRSTTALANGAVNINIPARPPQPPHARIGRARSALNLSATATAPANAIATPFQAPLVKRLTAASVRIGDLPTFTQVGNKWKNVFLPTIYHLLYLSDEPFKGFAIATPKLAHVVQEAVNIVYDEASYSVAEHAHVGDPILLVVYNRINERRGHIAQHALDLISKHVKSCTNLTEAHQWLSWAHRLTGPLFFEDPTPAYCTVERGEPGFIEPGGRLKSPFMIALVQAALDQLKGSAMDSWEIRTRVPVGLLALVMTALERAAHIVQADGSVPARPRSFSDENYGYILDGYTRVLRSIGIEKWSEILKLCTPAGADSDDDDFAANRSAADIDRDTMFCFDSPKKRA